MNKLKSRTFWFSIIWTSFVPLSILIQSKIDILLPINDIVFMAGSIVIIYIGGNKLVKNTSIKTDSNG